MTKEVKIMSTLKEKESVEVSDADKKMIVKGLCRCESGSRH
jgi:hypothetical protein